MINQFETTSLIGLVANDAIYETNIAPESVRYIITFDSFGTSNVYLGGPMSAAPVLKSLKKSFMGWYTDTKGYGERWLDHEGKPLISCYGAVGDTTLYNVWIRNGATDADYRLSPSEVEIGDESIVIPVSAENPVYTETSLEFAKVRASKTLPIPDDAQPVDMQIKELKDGRKAFVIERDTSAGSKFYRIDVEEVRIDTGE